MHSCCTATARLREPLHGRCEYSNPSGLSALTTMLKRQAPPVPVQCTYTISTTTTPPAHSLHVGSGMSYANLFPKDLGHGSQEVISATATFAERSPPMSANLLRKSEPRYRGPQPHRLVDMPLLDSGCLSITRRHLELQQVFIQHNNILFTLRLQGFLTSTCALGTHSLLSPPFPTCYPDRDLHQN